MVKLTYNSGCRLGNRLFMYAAGRLLARKLGLALQSSPLDGFPRTRDVIRGETIIGGPTHKVNGANPIPSWPDVDHLRRKNIEIEHGFVNSRYFVNRDVIRSWFWADPEMEVDDDDVLVNVRLREFVDMGLALEPGYYTTILSRMKFKKLYLMTDEPDSLYMDVFKQYNPIPVLGHGVEHFRKALAFKRIVMSNSTFCWWFTFVSRAKEIWFPMLNGSRCGSWCLGGLPDIDLRWDWPNVTTVYNIRNTLGDGPRITEAQRGEALSFGKHSTVFFL